MVDAPPASRALSIARSVVGCSGQDAVGIEGGACL
jgi:hypothetical protein